VVAFLAIFGVRRAVVSAIRLADRLRLRPVTIS
jgi:hypothetical protein